MSTKKTIYNVPVADRHRCADCGMPGAGFTPAFPDRALCLTCIERAREADRASDQTTASLYGFDDPEAAALDDGREP